MTLKYNSISETFQDLNYYNDLDILAQALAEHRDEYKEVMIKAMIESEIKENIVNLTSTFRGKGRSAFLPVLKEKISVTYADKSKKSNKIKKIGHFKCDSAKNSFITENIATTSFIYGTYPTTSENIIVKNCVINRIHITSTGSVIFQDNIINGSIDATNTILSHNIIRGTVTQFPGSNASFNICSETQFAAENNNQQNVYVGDDVLIVGTGGDDLKWRLRSSSPAVGAGYQGADIGMFGGPAPYVVSGIPALPTVQFINVPGIGTTTLENIEVTFKSRN